MHIAHAVFWADDYGGHPRPFTHITYEDVRTGKWKPVNPDNKAHCLSYTGALEDEGHQNTVWYVYI